jgi:hypothetical protein
VLLVLALKTLCSGRGLLALDASTGNLGTFPLALHLPTPTPSSPSHPPSSPSRVQPSKRPRGPFQTCTGTVAGFPSTIFLTQRRNCMYEWQPWRSRFLASIYKEEDFCPLFSSGDKFWRFGWGCDRMKL